MTHELTLPQRAAVALGSAEHEQALILLAKESTDIVAVTNADGRDQAHRVGMTLRAARTSITKAGKAARDDATAFGKAVIAEEKRLVAIIEPEEERVIALRDEFDAAEQARKDALIAAERARVEKIQSDIQSIRNMVTLAAGRSSLLIEELMDELNELRLTEERFAEFLQEATNAVTGTMVTLGKMLDDSVAAEAESLRQQQEREAAEAKAKQEREELAAAQAKLKRDQEAAAAELKKQRDALEADRVETARLAKVESDKVAQRRQMEDDKRAHDLKVAQDKIAADNEELRKQRAEVDRKLDELILATAATEPVPTPKEAKIDAMIAASEELESALVAPAACSATPLTAPEYRPSAKQIIDWVAFCSGATAEVVIGWLGDGYIRAIAQEERACRAEDALADLVNQIRKCNPVDDHGHDFVMNMAVIKAMKLLDEVTT